MPGIRIVLCALLVVGQQTLFAQAPRSTAPAPALQTSAPSVKTSLNALTVMLARTPSAPTALSFAKFRVKNVLDKLVQLSARWPAESPADYRANLDASVRAFERELSASDPAQLTAFLESLGDDLEVKLEHCTKSGGTLGGSVLVNVRTLDGDHESRNWQVFYMPKIFEAAGSTTPDRFPRLSSPTSETLVPGRYVVWGRDSANHTTERVTVKVGEGRKELPLELLVPSGVAR